ncbi:MAG: hypothetical protein HOQ28_14820 [Thermoleophilia bacterium]|nr:hypothetical protein [Thermoleophilia bacterium]
MATIPDTIVLKRDRDLDGRQNDIWVRRGLFALLCVVPVLALLNLFGQRPSTSSAAVGAAHLEVYAPTRVRGGVLFEARFNVTAQHDLQKAILVLDAGWLEGMTINGVEPQPVAEASADGRLSLDLGHIPAGKKYLLFMQFQVNPTNVGHRNQTVQLYDGDRKLAEVRRTITVFP